MLCHRVQIEGGKSPSFGTKESGRFRNPFGTRKKLRSDPDPRTSISSWSWSIDHHRADYAGVSTRKKRFTAQENPTDLKVSPCGTPDCVASSSCCCCSSEFSCAVCGRYAKQQQQQQTKGTESSSWNSSQDLRSSTCSVDTVCPKPQLLHAPRQPESLRTHHSWSGPKNRHPREIQPHTSSDIARVFVTSLSLAHTHRKNFLL